MKNSNKLFSYFFIIGIIFGSVIGKWIFIENNIENGILNEYLLEKMVNNSFSKEGYLIYVFEERLKLFLFLYLTTRFKKSKKIVSVLYLLIGIAMGIGFVTLVDRYMVYGIIVFLCMVLPHWWIYLWIYKKMECEEQIILKVMFKYLLIFILAIMWEGYIVIEILRFILKRI